ncbi:MAG: hypothetical protein DRN49_02895 [Thaumarchaeota archaeon]|nr:MAG: hypothetical protein DRN49_02895 [Nitrososphaerota archaeon]
MSGGSKDRSSMEVVLDSISSPIRLQILRNLSKKEMNYSELMETLGLERDRDAGKFSYHLKKLLTAELIEVDQKSRKYGLSRKGEIILEYLGKLERELGERRMLIVRRSDQLIEPFDKTKIAKALIREAKLTPRLAEEIASIAERKLLDLKIDYLTAPLIRELVNSILLDRGLERYRHMLTRVGLPIYDVSRILKRFLKLKDYRFFLERSSGSIIREYTILNMLPRDVAEEHLSGRIDIYPISSWLIGLFARKYEFEKSGEFTELLAEILHDSLSVRKEIMIEFHSEIKPELLAKMLSAIISNFPIDRILSVKLGNYAFEKLVQGIQTSLRRRLALIVDLSEFSSKRFRDFEEKVHRLGIPHIYVFGGDLLLSGYGVRDKSPLIHSIGTINLPGAALESRRNLDEMLEKIRERVTNLASALLEGLKLMEEIYGKNRIKSIISFAGLMEASKYLAGSTSFISEDVISTAKIILSNLNDCVNKVSDGKIGVAGRCPRSAAKRFLKIDSYRFGEDLLAKLVGSEMYSYLPILGRERFKSTGDRFEADLELAPLMSSGYIISLNFRKGLRLYKEIFSHLERLSKVNLNTGLILT